MKTAPEINDVVRIKGSPVLYIVRDVNDNGIRTSLAQIKKDGTITFCGWWDRSVMELVGSVQA